MCGLFGALGSNLSDVDVEFVRGLGLLSQFRGKDSTGFISLARNKDNQNQLNYATRKEVSPAGYFVNTQDTVDWMRKPFLQGLIGHSRAATVGTVTEDNAHPFASGGVVGVHNGHMAGAFPAKDGKSDSRQFFEMAGKDGMDAALEKAQRGGSAYALIWLDIKKCVVHVLRNKDRPLWFMSTADNRVHYFASEFTFLDFMDKRDTVKYKKPLWIPENHLYTWSPRTNAWTFEKLEEPAKPFKVRDFRSAAFHERPRDGEQDYKDWWEEGYKQTKEYPEGGTLDILFPNKGQDITLTKKERKKQAKLREERRKAAEKQLAMNPTTGGKVILLNPPVKVKPLLVHDGHTVEDYNSIEFLSQEDDKFDYLGYNSFRWGIRAAKNMLVGKSCSICTETADVNTKVYWASKEDYLCRKCYQSSFMRIMEGSRLDDYFESRILYKTQAI